MKLPAEDKFKTDSFRIAIAGNPNSGKSTLFNVLTGLNQKIGNYPGVTVDKKIGYFSFSPLSDGEGLARPAPLVGRVRSKEAIIIDLPGAYGLQKQSEDERISTEVITDKTNPDYPDIVIYVADASNLKRSLLFFTQIFDREVPVVLALNMMDVAGKKGLEINTEKLSPGVWSTVCWSCYPRLGFF